MTTGSYEVNTAFLPHWKFKEHGSTNACTFMVKETIQYYLQNGSNVYGTVLDATKAFDRIDFCKLFREMIKENYPHLLYV